MSSKIINKAMDRRDLYTPEAAVVVRELDSLIRELRAKNLRISSWYGVFDLDGDSESFERVNRGYGHAPLEQPAEDRNFPWFLYCALRAGQFPRWQFPLVKWWNDYTFGALFQEKVG